MRVLITGGTGQIGRATTERMLRLGWDVRVIDLASEAEIDGAEYARCDILDYDALLGHMRGCDAVIHLAAIRSPLLAPGHDIFQVNVQGTFNVFEAAAAAGIRRVVQASSINAVGAFYQTVDIEPRYLPLDEQHPRVTTDPYSFSKQVVEDIGDYYWRREGISGVALRFPGVYGRDYPQSDAYRQRRAAALALLDDLLSLPASEQEARIAAVKQRVLDYRRTRPFEFRPGHSGWPSNPLFDDPLFRAYITDRFNFWAFIDERDAAQSLEKGVTAAYDGAHPLFANAARNWLGCDSRALIRLFFPEVARVKSDLSGDAALVSIDRARALIGFEPEYSEYPHD